MYEKSKQIQKIPASAKNIEALERENSRFKRVYSEYENMADELWNLENSTDQPVPDDFINAIMLQSSYLEDEIEDWLIKFNNQKADIKH